MATSGSLLSTFDFVVFFGALLAIMAVGLWVGRREKSSKDYFLAGGSARWWGVAGSIFGSNVSANHMVGMMGVGIDPLTYMVWPRMVASHSGVRP